MSRSRLGKREVHHQRHRGAHDRRRILHFGVTAHPTAEWTAQQLREAFPWETAPRYLLSDRDRIFGSDFVQQVKVMGIKQVLSAPRSPWQSARTDPGWLLINSPSVQQLYGQPEPPCRSIAPAWSPSVYQRSVAHKLTFRSVASQTSRRSRKCAAGLGAIHGGAFSLRWTQTSPRSPDPFP
jgi:hypothetical protein